MQQGERGRAHMAGERQGERRPHPRPAPAAPPPRAASRTPDAARSSTLICRPRGLRPARIPFASKRRFMVASWVETTALNGYNLNAYTIYDGLGTRV